MLCIVILRLLLLDRVIVAADRVIVAAYHVIVAVDHAIVAAGHVIAAADQGLLLCLAPFLRKHIPKTKEQRL